MVHGERSELRPHHARPLGPGSRSSRRDPGRADRQGLGPAQPDQRRALALPFHLAVVQLEHGEWLKARGRPGDAQPLLAEARDTFEHLEAMPWLERVDALESGATAEVGV